MTNAPIATTSRTIGSLGVWRRRRRRRRSNNNNNNNDNNNNNNSGNNTSKNNGKQQQCHPLKGMMNASKTTNHEGDN